MIPIALKLIHQNDEEQYVRWKEQRWALQDGIRSPTSFLPIPGNAVSFFLNAVSEAWLPQVFHTSVYPFFYTCLSVICMQKCCRETIICTHFVTHVSLRHDNWNCSESQSGPDPFTWVRNTGNSHSAASPSSQPDHDRFRRCFSHSLHLTIPTPLAQISRETTTHISLPLNKLNQRTRVDAHLAGAYPQSRRCNALKCPYVH